MTEADVARPMPGGRVLAAFDFDGTLIVGDSFWHFLAAVVGWPRTAWAFVLSLLAFGRARLHQRSTESPLEARTFLKNELINRILGGRKLSDLEPALSYLAASQEWNETVRGALLDHAAQGHHIVIISGALNLYLPQLVKSLPTDKLICTTVGVDNGIIIGGMPDGNCVRLRKAELLRAYIEAHGPFTDSWGYGNYPHDMPMLQLLKQRILI